MPNSRCFIQFPHPGGEYRPGPSGWDQWNDLRCAHARKFMQFDGEWIDDAGGRHSGELRAWGEWEAHSKLLRELRQPDSREYPKYLWHPYFTELPGGHEGLHNTDPFIFGERMLYTNCKQSMFPVLRRLARGSVIAFGSKKNHRWILDTVFVVAGSVDYAAPEARIALADHASDAFLEVTAGPLADNGETGPFTFYWGATPEEPVDGMFSFFPAMRAGGSVGFERPTICLPKTYFTETLGRGIKSQRDLAPSTLVGLWRSLVEQVLNAGLVLGTHAALPELSELPRGGASRHQISSGPPTEKRAAANWCWGRGDRLSRGVEAPKDDRGKGGSLRSPMRLRGAWRQTWLLIRTCTSPGSKSRSADALEKYTESQSALRYLAGVNSPPAGRIVLIHSRVGVLL